MLLPQNSQTLRHEKLVRLQLSCLSISWTLCSSHCPTFFQSYILLPEKIAWWRKCENGKCSWKRGGIQPGRVISPQNTLMNTLSYDTRLVMNRFGRASVTAAADSVRMCRKVRPWDVKLETLQRRGRRFVSSNVLCVLVRGHKKSPWLQLNRWLSSMPLNSELSHPIGTPGKRKIMASRTHTGVYLCGFWRPLFEWSC